MKFFFRVLRSSAALITASGFVTGGCLVAQTPAPVLIPNTMSTAAGNVHALDYGAAAPFGFTADGTSAVSATLGYPQYVAVDPKGELYFLDAENAIIRQVDDSGVLRTVAGTAPAVGCAPTNSSTYGATYSGTLNGVVYSGAPYCWNNGTSGTMFGNAAHNVPNPGVAATSSGFGIGYAGKSLAGPVFDSFGNMYITESQGFYGVSVVYRGGAALAAFLKTLYPNATITPGNAYVLTGGATASYTVSNTAALSARFKAPGAVGVDAQGNVYIPDENGFIQVLNIQTTSITVAGTTIMPGAVSTILGNTCVATTGCSTTVNPINNTAASAASNGSTGADALVVDRWGNIYLANKSTGSGVAMVVAIYAGAPNAVIGPANPLYGMLSAIYPSLGGPSAGYTYILSGNGATTPTATAASTWLVSAPNSSLGGTAAGFSNGQIQAIAVDTAGNVYFTDNTRLFVWRIDAINGETALIAGGAAGYPVASLAIQSKCYNNTATSAFSYLGDGCETLGIHVAGGGNYGLALDPAGNLYMTQSTTYDVVEKLSIGTNFPSTAVGSTSTAQRIRVHFYTSNLYQATGAFSIAGSGAEFSFTVTPTPSSVCLKNSADGSYDCVVTVAFKPAGTGLRTAQLIATDAGGNQHSFKLNGVGTGAQVTFDADQGTNVATGLVTPAGVAVDGAGTVYTSDATANILYRTKAGGAATAFVSTGLNAPAQVAVDSAGNVYVADSGNNRIAMVTPQGTVSTVALQLQGVSPATLAAPQGVAVDRVGNLYIADTGNARILMQPANGQYEAQTVVTGTSSANKYVSLATDALGNLYVADTSANSVTEYPQAAYGLYTVEAGPAPATVTYTSGSVKQPLGVAVDPAGSVYVADGGSNAVYVFTAGQTTTPVALISSGLATPSALALDASSNLYVADSGNNRVFEEYRGAQTLAFGDVGIGTTVSYPVEVGSYGNVATTLTNFSITPIFAGPTSASTQCMSTTQLKVGGYCSAVVAYSPTASNPGAGVTSTGTLQATDNAQGSPQTITLSAKAVVQQAQTINYTPIAALTYGHAPILLSSAFSATSGLPITYTVTGPGSVTKNGTTAATLVITGAGAITIVANQAGNGDYLAAAALTETVTVGKAVLTFTAGNLTSGVGVIPPLANDYLPTGYVNGDTASTAFTGQPSVTTTATTSSLAGNYPITIAVGTLVSANYSFVFVGATLTLEGTGQIITFNPLSSPVVFARQTIPLVATSQTFGGAATGQTVTFSIASGGAFGTISGTNLIVTGAGTIVVQADQAGTYSSSNPNGYAPAASVQQTVVVSPAPLTVNAGNATRLYGVSAITYSPTVTGAVAPDAFNPTDTSALSVSPFTPVSVTSAASTASVTYTITPTVAPGNSGTLLANYTITTVPGVLTITPAPTNLTLTPSTTSVAPGGTVTLTATLTSAGLPGGVPSGTFTFSPVPTGVNPIPAAGLSTASLTLTPTASSTSYTVTYTGDANFVSSTSTPVTVNEPVTNTVTTLTSTNFQPGTGQMFTLQATVASTLTGATAATGTVTFTAVQNGATLMLGSVPVTSAGLANLTLSIPTAGVLALTATYSGDSLHSGSSATLIQITNVSNTSGNVVPVVVGTPTFEISLTALTQGLITIPSITNMPPYAAPTPPVVCSTPPTGTSVSNTKLYAVPDCLTTTTSVTGKAGQVFQQVVTIQSYFGLADKVTMTCTGLPVNAACQFAPNVTLLTPTASGQQVVVSIDTVKALVRNDVPFQRKGGEVAWAMLLLGSLGLLGVSRRVRGSLAGKAMTLVAVLALGASAMGLSGCGNSSTYATANAGTYAVVITATDGTVTQSVTVNLTLQ